MGIKVQPLTVGAILGATSGQSARLWGRGKMEKTENGPRRCFGVVRARPATSSHFRQPIFFKMNPNFDMTGVVMLSDLEPEKEYDYQIGYFFSDMGLHDFAPDYPLDWSAIDTVSFRSAASDKSHPRSFVYGSCRYLLRLFGGSWFDNRGDKTFRSILRQMDQGTQTDMVLMLGDQIYADDLSFIGPDQSVDEYNARYREAFSQPYIRQLMSRVPTYMIMDDHEIEDNWPANATYEDWVIKYPAAIHAYQTYQGSHNPVLPMVEENQMAGVAEKFWYTFQDGCCDFFVTDVRTERYLAEDPVERRIMNDQQMDALKNWLADGSERVKFVVSSVAFFPDPTPNEDRKDMWGGFIKQRGEILDLIRNRDIKRVVFLGGDYHFSMKSEVTSPGKPHFRVLSVISSAFFWPYPHGSWRSFQDNGELMAISPHTYEVVNSSKRFGTDNFTRISVDLEKLRIEIFSRKGEPIYETEYTFG